MQAFVLVLASLIGGVAALSLQYVNAQQQCDVTGDYLTSFSCGNVSNENENGTIVRNYTLLAEETHQIPITMAENSTDQVIFPGWTFNGTIPGPTLRMTEGDIVNIKVVNSPQSEKHHSLHMHSIHKPDMDGTVGPAASIAPGDSFTYTFVAGPSGLYPYHCHVNPIQDHINRGLYGVMIIDPKTPRPPANEMVMMMNSYDLGLNQEMQPTAQIPTAEEANHIMYPPIENEDGEEMTEEEIEEARPELEVERDNEIYTVNGKAFEYANNPIPLQLGEPVRIYLLSMTEFDPVNNLHLHSTMFNYTASGTDNSAPIETDIVTLGQGDRGIIEFTPQNTGMHMFHAHVNEFADLGWMSMFHVYDKAEPGEVDLGSGSSKILPLSTNNTNTTTTNSTYKY
jgi:manganese oxidase